MIQHRQREGRSCERVLLLRQRPKFEVVVLKNIILVYECSEDMWLVKNKFNIYFSDYRVKYLLITCAHIRVNKLRTCNWSPEGERQWLNPHTDTGNYSSVMSQSRS